MIERILFLSLSCALAVIPAEASGPYVVGERSREISPGDLADIIAITGPHGSVWLMDVHDVMFLGPPNLQVVAYLFPETTTANLRRGRALRVDQDESSAASLGYEWRVRGRPTAWAQVARPDHEFGKTIGRPRGLDYPFRVEGKVSDSDLVDLVRFIRTSPSKPGLDTENPDGSWSIDTGAAVNGANPIISVAAKGDCFFEVTTAYRRGAGQVIEVTRGDHGWEVLKVIEWVA